MANNVNVKGGGDFDGATLENAATEKTLQDLVNIFKAKGKDGNKVFEIYNKVLDKNIEATEETIDKHEEWQKTLKNSKSTLEKFSETLGDITKSAVSGIFSGLVATGSMLIDFFKTGFDAFQQTNQVGASFNYSILELRRAASDAAMPIEEFTKFITENSKSLGAFGGTVTEGAKAFSVLREQFTDPAANNELYNLGLTANDLNKILAEQLKTEMVSGRSRELDRTRFTKELTEYTKDLNKLSKVTGISTQQLQEGVTQQMADGRMITLQNKLTGKSLLNFREGLALMNAELDPKVFDTLKNMMSGVIDPADKFGAMLAVAAPGVMQFQEALGAGKLTIDQQLAGYEKQVAQIGNFLGRFSKQQIARIPELKAMQEYLASIKKFTGANGKAELEGRAAMDGIIGLFSSFGEIINRVKNLFLKAFINTGTMERIEKAFNRLTAFIQEKGPLIVKRLEPVMESIGKLVDRLVNGLIALGSAFAEGDLKPENIWKWFQSVFGDVAKIISDGFNAVIGGLLGTTPEQQQQRQEYDRATPEEKEKMRKKNPMLAMPDTGGIFDKMAAGLKSLIDMVPTLKDLALFFGVVGGGSFVAGLGLAAGISAVGAALWEILIPAGLLGVAMGFGFGGLGYALNGVSNIIDSLSGGLTKLSEFFKSIAEADPAKMQSASASIKSLASAMSELAASGLVGLITGGTISSLADSLTKFAMIDYNKFSTAGSALKTLHEGLAQFTGGVMDSITGFFSSDGGLDTVIKSLTKLNDIDLGKLQGVAELGKFFDAIKPFLNPDIVTKLPESLKMVKQSLDDFASSIGSSVNNLANSGLRNVVDAFKQLGTLTTNIANANLGSGIIAIINNLQKLNAFDLKTLDGSKIGALSESLQKLNGIDINVNDEKIKNVADSLQKLTSIDITKLDNTKVTELAENLQKLTSIDVKTIDDTKINALADSLKTFNNLDITKISSTIGAINNNQITFGDNLSSQASNVDGFVKSIDNLVESLKKLEVQMKANSNAPKISTTSDTGIPTDQRVVNDTSATNNLEDPQRQLNMKIDELITHIKEMKQNTKDTADSLNNRRSAL